MGDGVVVVGVGNALRGDDAAGLAVARALRSRALAAGVRVAELEGEALGLIELWEDARAAVVVDGVRSGAAPGTVVRIDAGEQPLPAGLRGSASTHAVGVGAVIELARTLDRMPERVIVYGIEAESFATGAELSPAVAASVAGLADAVLAEARELQNTGDSV